VPDPKDSLLPSSQPLATIPLLQLLLFVDDRPTAQEQIVQIQSYLQSQTPNLDYNLTIIDIREQPHLVEYFRLVATPALVKISPEPRQTLAGSNLVNQLQRWYPKWQLSIQSEGTNAANNGQTTSNPNATSSSLDGVSHSAEMLRLSDEIFRLKKEQERLHSQLKFKDQVLEMLAHDLRSPLTAALIAVDTLEILDRQSNCAERPPLKEQIFHQARNQFSIMNRLITDILQAAKGMNTELNLKSQPLNLPTLCQAVLEQISPRIQSQSLTLKMDLPHDIPSVFADEELIRQVFLNLLDNAIKYTPEGGKITISILHRTSQKVQVSISDTGPGIPAEKQEQIFDGHFRLQRDRQKDGYGLGLALCRKIIRDHYGQIWVSSNENQGSHFHFTLPVYRLNATK
jgi:two-component system clock-associated histidine kinase SasA